VVAIGGADIHVHAVAQLVDADMAITGAVACLRGSPTGEHKEEGAEHGLGGNP
jgi:hypothetical protein